jgi:hypothetical protein
MCDVDATTDPAIHTETTIEAEPGPDHVQDGETSGTLAALTTPGEDNHIPASKVISEWSPAEKRQLRSFLSTRGHLSWSRIAQEYEEMYHMGRSPSSIAGQARCLGLSVGRKPRKKRARPAKRDPLVLKVRFPSNNKPSLAEPATPNDRVQQPAGISLGGEAPQEIVQQTHQLPDMTSSPIDVSLEHARQLQDMTSSPMDVSLVSPFIGPNVPSMVQFSTTKNFASVRQSNYESPGSFGLILN